MKKVKPNGIGIEFEGDENRGGAVSLKETEIETRELISIKKRLKTNKSGKVDIICKFLDREVIIEKR